MTKPLLALMIPPVVGLLLGTWGGIQTGVVMSAEHGPRAACEMIRFPVLSCDSISNTE